MEFSCQNVLRLLLLLLQLPVLQLPVLQLPVVHVDVEGTGPEFSFTESAVQISKAS